MCSEPQYGESLTPDAFDATLRRVKDDAERISREHIAQIPESPREHYCDEEGCAGLSPESPLQPCPHKASRAPEYCHECYRELRAENEHMQEACIGYRAHRDRVVAENKELREAILSAVTTYDQDAAMQKLDALCRERGWLDAR